MATREEMAMSETMRDEVVDLQGILRDPMQSNTFQDLRGERPPPRKGRRRVTFAKEDETPDRKKARNMMRGTKSVRKLLSAVPGGEVRKIRLKQRRVSGPRAPRRRGARDEEVKSDASPSIAPEAPEADQAAPEGQDGVPPEEAMAPEVDEEEIEENREIERILHEPTEEEVARAEAEREEWDQLEPGAKRQRLQDDVPPSLKRKLMDRDDLDHDFMPEKKSRVSEGLVAQVVKSIVDDGPANEWVTRYELALLKQLTGLPLSAARLHRAPRKRMMKPPKSVARSRLTVMIGKDPVDAFVVEESAAEVEQNPRRKAGFEWTGMTMLVKEPPAVPRQEKRYPTYIKSEKGLFEVNMTYNQRAAFEEIWFEDTRNCLVSEIMLLKLKQSGKELDPKAFGPEEWKQFQMSDTREWEQWIDNGVMRRVSKKEEKEIPKSKIFRSPLRMVRTNKTGGLLLPLVAKSRLVVPGHLDPGLGLFRTDAPTVSLMATRLAKAVAAGRGWNGWSFDITTAFLSGDHTDREIYVRAPPEGLPPARGQSAVEPLELLQILKSAYGLTEAPRLWYLRANRNIQQTPLKELAASRATYVAADEKTGVSWAILCLHVDDGLLLGSNADPRFVRLKDQINGLFKIKEWKRVPLTFLGVDLKESGSGIMDDMSSYVRNIKVPTVERKADDVPLDAKELTSYRQLVMRMRWPAQLAMPQLLYEVSLLAQRVSKATHGDFKEALKLHQKFLQEVEEGRAVLKYPKMDGIPYLVTFFDASLGKEADGKSQLGAIHFLTDEEVVNGPRPASVVEFSTTKSTRVVRSSMAAESCSMSIAVDRHMYGRLILDMLLRGCYEVKPTWREDCKVKGGLVTDAKSLFDHLNTTGQIPQERQTMLDLLAAKHLLDRGLFKLFWVPTHRQFADGLTKRMKDALWAEFVQRGTLSLVETPAERALEEHRRALRKGQRQRRKDKFRGSATKEVKSS